MISAASEAGFTMNRNTLRSQLWQAKKDGLVEALAAGRYRSPQEEEEYQGGFSSEPPKSDPRVDFARARKLLYEPAVGPTPEDDDEIPF
jgi:hypothetical protein